MTKKPLFLIIAILLAFTISQALPPVDLPAMEFAEKPKPRSMYADSLEEDIYYLLVQESEDALKKNDFETASLRIIEAMGHEPDNPNNIPLLSNLAMIYSVTGRDTLALEAYDMALSKAPAMTTVRNNRARLLLKLENDSAAFADFSRVLQQDSVNATALYYHGLMSLYGCDLATAETDFGKLKKVAPNSLDTHIALATLYSLTGRDIDAIRHFRKIIERDGAPEYYAGLAGCQLSLGNLTEASETLTQALKLHPNDPELLYYRAWLNRDRYRLDDARRDAADAIRAGANPLKVKALFEKK